MIPFVTLENRDLGVTPLATLCAVLRLQTLMQKNSGGSVIFWTHFCKFKIVSVISGVSNWVRWCWLDAALLPLGGSCQVLRRDQNVGKSGSAHISEHDIYILVFLEFLLFFGTFLQFLESFWYVLVSGSWVPWWRLESPPIWPLRNTCTLRRAQNVVNPVAHAFLLRIWIFLNFWNFCNFLDRFCSVLDSFCSVLDSFRAVKCTGDDSGLRIWSLRKTCSLCSAQNVIPSAFLLRIWIFLYFWNFLLFSGEFLLRFGQFRDS